MTERTRNKPLRWLPYHKRLIGDLSRYVLTEKSRRVGWDYAHAYKSVTHRLSGKVQRDLWYTSADESAAYEFAEYCRFFMARVNAVADSFTEHLGEAEDHKGAIKAFCIRMPNGVRINALSSSPRRLRSKGGDVSISEFAFHDDPVALYAAAQPVIMWGGRLEIGSTHNGETAMFAKVCQDARDVANGIRERGGRKLTPWSYHFVDIFRAVEDGLVELINETKGTSFTRDQFLADLRSGCLTEDDWQQEYCCKPSTESSAWLPYATITGCESPECPQPSDGLALGRIGGDQAVFAGIDVGRHHDLTVMWILGQVGDVRWTRSIIELQGMTIPMQIDVLDRALRVAGVQRCAIDATGIGLGLAEELQRRHGSVVEAVTFTGPTKEKLAVPVRQAFEERTLRIPDNAVVREDLHKVRKTISGGGNVRFDAGRDKDGHADRFWALALALDAAATPQGFGISIVDPWGATSKPDEVDVVEQERKATAEAERLLATVARLKEESSAPVGLGVG